MKKIIVLQATIFILFCGMASSFGQTVSEEAKRHFDRGMAAMEMANSPDDYAAAIKEFEHAARLAPGWPAVYYNLGLVQEKAEKYSDAVINLQQYLRLAPNASDAEAVKSLINKLAYKNESIAKDASANVKDEDGYSPPDINAKDEYGLMPLFVAVRNRDKEWVKLLIAEGADVNGMLNDGWTPLAIAARNGYEDVAELLIAEGADINAKNKDGISPLAEAVLSGQKEMAEMLIDKGADMNAKDKYGNTLLHSAVARHQMEMAELLIANGMDVNARNNNGETPLYLAVDNGYKDVVELLIAKGADVNAKDKSGISPLKMALWRKGFGDIADLLCKQAGLLSKLEALAESGRPEVVFLFFLFVAFWFISFLDIIRNDFKGNIKLIWLFAVSLVPFLGPICYFFIGRKQKLGGKNQGSPPIG